MINNYMPDINKLLATKNITTNQKKSTSVQDKNKFDGILSQKVNTARDNSYQKKDDYKRKDVALNKTDKSRVKYNNESDNKVAENKENKDINEIKDKQTDKVKNKETEETKETKNKETENAEKTNETEETKEVNETSREEVSEELANIEEEISKIVAEIMNLLESSEMAKDDDETKQEVKELLTELKGIMEQMGDVFEEFNSKYPEDLSKKLSEAGFEELSKEIEVMLGDLKNKMDLNSKVGKVELNEADVSDVKEIKIDTESQNDSNSDLTNNQSSNMEGQNVNQNLTTNNSETAVNVKNEGFAIVELKNGQMQIVQKSEISERNTLQFNKNDLFEEIVDRARMNIRGDKTEMVMKLKPQELGELSLKIVMEKGIMVGKAVVDNMQVKALVDANLAQLKENLNEKGIEIESFEVSVRKDGNFEENQGQQWARENKKKFKRMIESTESIEDIISAFDKYDQATNTGINIMA